MSRSACPGRREALALLLLGLAALAPGISPAQGWKPTQNIEIIAPSGAGGSIDRTCRLIQGLLKEVGVTEVTSSVVNKTGGGHSIGYAYLNQHAEDPHYLLVTSTNLVTNRIAGTSAIGIRDVTPLSMLFNEYVVFGVAADSPIATAKDLVTALKSRPDTMTFGVGSAVTGANSVAVGLVAKAVGMGSHRPKIITFKSSTEGAVQLMGGHITTIASTPGIVLPTVDSGKIRVLAVAAPSRIGGKLANVPTWKELGIDIVVGNWRMLIGPRGLPAAGANYWEQVMAKVMATPAWRSMVESIAAQPQYMSQRETAAFLAEQDALFRGTFHELGILKK